MKKELCEKLSNAIFNYNASQQQENEKIDTASALTEIASMDNEQIEKAIEEMNKHSQQ